MKQCIFIILLLSTFSLLGQNNKILTAWTNGYQFYSAEKYNDSLIVFSGGDLHEGGYVFTLKNLEPYSYLITENPFNDYPSSVGKKNDFASLSIIDDKKVLIIKDTCNVIKEALVELTNISLEELIIKNKVKFELSGKYVDQDMTYYGFYPNEQKAFGFSTKEYYKFEYEYDAPINVITFCDSLSFCYEQTSKGLDIYQATIDQYGDWKRGNKYKSLTKFEWLNTTQNIDLKGNYPVASTEILIKGILWNFDKRELKIMRNEIFARHGYIFKTKEMKSYFESQTWYVGNLDNVNNKLTDLEKLNIRLIKGAEKE